jgi:hypothetical protein
LKADGSVVTQRQRTAASSPSRAGADERPGEPGDSILVPSWSGSRHETQDITQILYQIAVTAGVLILAF